MFQSYLIRLVFLVLLINSVSITSNSQIKRDKIIDSLTLELMNANALNRIYEKTLMQYQYLSVAKEMSLRSLETKDSVLQSLLAIQAFKFNRDYEGSFYDIEIYNSLYLALKRFNDPFLDELPLKIDLNDKNLPNKTYIMANKLCSYLKRNMYLSEWELYASHLKIERTCPLNDSRLKK